MVVGTALAGSRVFRGAQQSGPAGGHSSLRSRGRGWRKRLPAEPQRRWSTGLRRGPGPGEHALRVHGEGVFLGVVLAGLSAVVVLYWQ